MSPSKTTKSQQATLQKPSLRGIKQNARYVPGVPMTKEELREWRKKARRVRNRESAAACRARTRQRIEDLEKEITALKSKYEDALQTIQDLQQHPCQVSVTSDPIQVLSYDTSSPSHQDEDLYLDMFDSITTDPMISRPTAVCVAIP